MPETQTQRRSDGRVVVKARARDLPEALARVRALAEQAPEGGGYWLAIVQLEPVHPQRGRSVRLRLTWRPFHARARDQRGEPEDPR